MSSAYSKIQVKVLSPLQSLGDYHVWEVRIPAYHGEMGIRSQHTSFVGSIGVGVIQLQLEESVSATQKVLKFVVCGGFFEIQGPKLTFLVDQWEDSSSIDFDRAHQSRNRALARLKSQDATVDISRALASLKRAETRLSLQKVDSFLSSDV